MKRRVSRVESLRNLFFNRSSNNNGTAISGPEAKRSFLARKRRARSTEKVDKGTGTDSDYEDHQHFQTVRHHSHHRRRHSNNSRYSYYRDNIGDDTTTVASSACGDGECCCNDDIYDDDELEVDDSVSQISAMDSASQTGLMGGSVVESNKYSHQQEHQLSMPRSLSVGELSHNNQSANAGGHYRRGQFPYAYIRSKLSVLPEEQAGQLSRRESMNQVRKHFYIYCIT